MFKILDPKTDSGFFILRTSNPINLCIFYHKKPINSTDSDQLGIQPDIHFFIFSFPEILPTLQIITI